MNTSLVITIIGTLLVGCVYLLLRRDRNRRYHGDRILPGMRAKLDRLRKVDSAVNLASIPLWLYFMFLFGRQMQQIAASDIQQLPGTVWFLASGGFWYAIGCFYGLGIIGLLQYVGWRLFLGRRKFDLWMDYGELTTGKNVRLWGSLLLIATIGGGTLLMCLGLGRYTRVTEESLIVNSFWSLGESVHDHRNVTSIEVRHWLRDKEDPPRPIPKYKIEYRDGYVWNSDGRLRDVHPAYCDAAERLVQYVSDQSGVAVREKD
ncbi:MAG: hypothetical protein HQ567_14420 [Candidatus Nealsonbacteria bacterium]|nr:hypothetical protein [Candidatus Nealsonbacteria bacterium]